MRHLGMIVLLAIMGVSASCTLESTTVSKSSALRRLPHTPEGVWRDLELAALQGKTASIPGFFSRRYLLKRVDPTGKPPTYTRDPADYASDLQASNERLEQFGEPLRGFASSVQMRLRRFREFGTFVAERVKESVDIYDDRSQPRGPNTGFLYLMYWPEGVGVDAPLTYRVSLVQEFECWRIDAIDPDLFAE